VQGWRITSDEELAMTNIRNEILAKLWFGRDPLGDAPVGLFQEDLQGWNSQHPYLGQAIERLSLRIIVEVGVWKGASTIFMASAAKARGIDSVVIAVDTWLGSAYLWRYGALDQLKMWHGTPMIYETFLANITSLAVADYVVPLRLDSLNAATVVADLKITADAIHIDAGHDYLSVRGDLHAWWPTLRAGGVLIGDDYFTDGTWPGVRLAVDEFFAAASVSVEHINGKFRVTKPWP
jgi:predicted O-methyltransferase YrrM